ncbi:MAG: formylglycine-generating enzyme family protein [Victivallales bacterium]|nr:formylglycine-generating enzyme family protein [Victivallales bacterium]
MKQNLKLRLWMVIGLALSAIALQADVKVKDISVKPIVPWSGKVEIVYSVECDEIDADGKPENVYLSFNASDHDNKIKIRTLSGDGAFGAVHAGGPYTVTWNFSKDEPRLKFSDYINVSIKARTGLGTYLVVNLKDWSHRFQNEPPDFTDDTCRTSELWLRQIPAGKFTMGSAINELGRGDEEVQHEVTIGQLFYIGIFECTQAQYQFVMGKNTSNYKGDCRPVERVSYDTIRGSSAKAGGGWPAHGHSVDATSFMGKLQKNTGMVFDLPTEAEWEYACRAGTTTALNSGKDLSSVASDANTAEVGRYYYNRTDGKGGFAQHTKVGSYLPNAWGLYDMYGNVWEWCLDSYARDEAQRKADSGVLRRGVRGGGWFSFAQYCRSAYQSYRVPSSSNYYCGFRITCWPLSK